MGLFDRLKQGLTKTRQGLVEKIDQLVAGKKEIDAEFYDDLEAVLIQADVGAATAMEVVEGLRRRVKEARLKTTAEAREELYRLIAGMLGREAQPLATAGEGPTVMMVVGVNGAGKTTTIGKLAARFKGQGKKVILGAGDTFRAAAVEQLEIWAERVQVPLIKQQAGSDPAAVAFDAAQAARARDADVLILDTAGRLHTKVNLMEELKKVKRILEREIPGAPHETLLVLDATAGQNAVSQARVFTAAVAVTGIVLTKLDGTARGGVILGIGRELGLPVKLIGLGEGVEDLRDFEPGEFARALFGEEPGDAQDAARI